jgi:hypothetical protein
MPFIAPEGRRAVMHGEMGMATGGQIIQTGRGSRWTLLLWAGAVLLLLLPFVAMRFTSEVKWTGSDFVLMGIAITVIASPLLMSAWLFREAARALK